MKIKKGEHSHNRGLGTTRDSHLDVQVLITEDDLELRGKLRGILERIGCTVTVVSDATLCSEAIVQSERQRNPFQVAFLSVSSPSFDGAETAEQVRKHGGLTPLIALDRFPSLGGKLHSIHSGFDSYLATNDLDTDLVSHQLAEVLTPLTRSVE